MTPIDAWAALEQVKDPEIPTVSVVELGLIREIEVVGGAISVTMTPSFSGCPALEVMSSEIVSCLEGEDWSLTT